MALTAPQIVICNLALGLLDETEISSSSTTDKAYVLCERYYTASLNWILQRHYWSEAKKRIAIGQTGVPLFGYAYEYTLPSDYIRFYRIDDTSIGSFSPRYSEDAYTIEDDKLLTNNGYVPDAFEGTGVAGSYYLSDDKAWLCKADTADTPTEDEEVSTDWELVSEYGVLTNIIYIRSIEPTNFTPLLADCVAHILAANVSIGLTRDRNISDSLRANVEQLILREAKSIDSMNKYPQTRFGSAWVNSRRS